MHQSTETCRTPDVKKDSEMDSGIMLQKTATPKRNGTVASRRKSTHNEEPPRKKARVSEAGPSTGTETRVFKEPGESYNKAKRIRGMKRKMTDGGEVPRPVKKKRGQLDHILVEEAASSSTDNEVDSGIRIQNTVSPGRNRTVASERKATHDEETPRKKSRVSVAGPSETRVFKEPGECYNQAKTIRGTKRKMTDGGEVPRPVKKKRGQLDRILVEEAASSSTDSGSTSHDIKDYYPSEGEKRTRTQKKKDVDEVKPSNRKKAKKTDTHKQNVTAQRVDFFQPLFSQINLIEPPGLIYTGNLRDFKMKYEEQGPLGEGGCGAVFAGYRRADNLPVAIKHIPKDCIYCKHTDENGRQLSAEVAVMLKLQTSTTSLVGRSAPVSLLDWYDLRRELIIVMERPVPAEDLFSYRQNNGGTLKEDKAKIILKQLLDAVMHLQRENIFHRDIKLENILIETGSDFPRLRLIDFGVSCMDKYGTSYNEFLGTPLHVPPEYLSQFTYSAEPTTVWQLGVVLFEILQKGSFSSKLFLKRKIRISDHLSEDCRDLLKRCLSVSPEERPTLEELQHHPWFTT